MIITRRGAWDTLFKVYEIVYLLEEGGFSFVFGVEKPKSDNPKIKNMLPEQGVIKFHKNAVNCLEYAVMDNQFSKLKNRIKLLKKASISVVFPEYIFPIPADELHVYPCLEMKKYAFDDPEQFQSLDDYIKNIDIENIKQQSDVELPPENKLVKKNIICHEKLEIFKSIVEVFNELQENKIYYGDCAPQNIYVTMKKNPLYKDTRVLLIDIPLNYDIISTLHPPEFYLLRKQELMENPTLSNSFENYQIGTLLGEMFGYTCILDSDFSKKTRAIKKCTIEEAEDHHGGRTYIIHDPYINELHERLVAADPKNRISLSSALKEIDKIIEKYKNSR